MQSMQDVDSFADEINTTLKECVRQTYVQDVRSSIPRFGDDDGDEKQTIPELSQNQYNIGLSESSMILEYKLQAIIRQNEWNEIMKNKRLKRRKHSSRHHKQSVSKTMVLYANRSEYKSIQHGHHHKNKEYHRGKKNRSKSENFVNQSGRESMPKYKRRLVESLDSLHDLRLQNLKPLRAEYPQEGVEIPKRMSCIFLENLIKENVNSLQILVNVRNVKMTTFCTNFYRISEDNLKKELALKNNSFGIIGRIFIYLGTGVTALKQTLVSVLAKFGSAILLFLNHIQSFVKRFPDRPKFQLIYECGNFFL